MDKNTHGLRYDIPIPDAVPSVSPHVCVLVLVVERKASTRFALDAPTTHLGATYGRTRLGDLNPHLFFELPSRILFISLIFTDHASYDLGNQAEASSWL